MQGVAIAIILTIIPAALFGTVMVMMGTAAGGLPAIAVGVAVLLVTVVFIAAIRAMQREHPSQAGGDPNLPEDRSPPDDDDDGDFDEMLTPTTWIAAVDHRDPPSPDLARQANAEGRPVALR
jgi:heme A synthase